MVVSRISRRRRAHRALRSVTTLPAGADALVDQHGYELYLMAHVLTADPEHAERLVAQAISAHGDGPRDLGELAAAVFVAWSAWGPLSQEQDPALPAGSSSSAQMMHDLHALPEDRRAAIALCRYGGHTYRQAADVLGLPAADTAQLLGQALRTLATPGVQIEPSPPAFVAS